MKRQAYINSYISQFKIILTFALLTPLALFLIWDTDSKVPVYGWIDNLHFGWAFFYVPAAIGLIKLSGFLLKDLLNEAPPLTPRVVKRLDTFCTVRY